MRRTTVVRSLPDGPSVTSIRQALLSPAVMGSALMMALGAYVDDVQFRTVGRVQYPILDSRTRQAFTRSRFGEDVSRATDFMPRLQPHLEFWGLRRRLCFDRRAGDHSCVAVSEETFADVNDRGSARRGNSGRVVWRRRSAAPSCPGFVSISVTLGRSLRVTTGTRSTGTSPL